VLSDLKKIGYINLAFGDFRLLTIKTLEQGLVKFKSKIIVIFFNLNLTMGEFYEPKIYYSYPCEFFTLP